MKKLVTIVFTLISLSVAQPLFAKSEERTEVRIESEIKKSGYVGETLSYEIHLLSTSPEISNVRVVKGADLPEGLKVIKGVTRNSSPKKIQEKGKTWYKWTIARDFLIPEKEGKFEIGEGKYIVFVPHERIVQNGFWGSMRTVDYEELPVSSKPVSFKIAALPALKPTADFSGCVGDFKIEGWFPPGKIFTGRDAYAVFSISGFGSLADLRLPNLYKEFGKGCRLKEVEQNEEQTQRDGRLYTEVTLTCKFVAEEENFEIAPLCLTFFNPDTRKYAEVCSDALHWSTSSTSPSSNPREAISI